MDGHGTGGDINPLNPTFSEGQNNSTHGVQQQEYGGVMNPNNNNNSLPMARCNSLDDMDGIDWSDNAVSFYIIAIVILRRAGFELCNMSLGNNIC